MPGEVRAPFVASALALGLAALVASLGCSSSSAPSEAASEEEDAGAACPALPTPRPFVRSSKAYPRDGELRVHELQAKATHNSYHLRPKNPVTEWDFEHAPLAVQLGEQGVRGVELDVHWDDECQRYRVFHIGLLDDRTTCAFFTDCLVALRTWSEAHPGHHPIFVHVEPKTGFVSSAFEARFASLEAEVKAVFDPAWILTPGEVKGSSPSLNEAVAARGWPTLGEARGRFVFYLDNDDALRDAYTHGRKDLEGRLFFADGSIDEPFVALQILNDPASRASAIAAALAKHHLVRTRADGSPADARAGSTAQRDAAFASGAQIVSTDFPAPVPGIPYAVEVPGGTPSRCAPGVAPSTCTAADIEDPSKLAR
jgi:hypothetical protein